MAFQRAGRGSPYYTELRVGTMVLPRLSTGLRDRASAEELERELRKLYEAGHVPLLKAVAERKVTLPQVWEALQADEPPVALARLVSPEATIAEAVDHMLDDYVSTDERVRVGLRRLKDLTPEGETLSWLTVPKNLNQVYRDAGKDRDESTVYRTVHRAVAELLSEHLGNGTALRILGDATKPDGDSRRHEIMTADEIHRWVYAAPDELRAALAFTVLTGIDRGPLLAARTADLDGDNLWVRDGKTHARRRYLPLEPGMRAWAAHMAKGKGPDDSLTGLTADVVRDRWEELRKAQGRDELRWKDLRGIFATWAYRCAWDALRIQSWIGHTNPVMTQRYIKRVDLLPREPREVAVAMKLTEVR
jgi:integrase